MTAREYQAAVSRLAKAGAIFRQGAPHLQTPPALAPNAFSISRLAADAPASPEQAASEPDTVAEELMAADAAACGQLLRPALDPAQPNPLAARPLLPCFHLPLAWYGGKSKLLKKLLPLVPPHKCYCEVFAGGAALFFRKEPAAIEVLNDLNSELANFYLQLKHNLPAFWDMHCISPASRDEFMAQRKLNPHTLPPFQRAWRFYYLNRLSFAARGSTYAVGASSDRVSKAKIFNRCAPHLLAAHYRLQSASIENLPWQECIRRHDRPSTFFYLDPPYYGSERAYGSAMFHKEDFAELASALQKIKGRFLLSINDTPETREIFKSLPLLCKTEVLYVCNREKNMKSPELIYGNAPRLIAGSPDLRAEQPASPASANTWK